jgi:hypothetical protein
MNAAPAIAMVRADDLALVQGHHAAAAILNLLRFWQGDRQWVQATQDEIRSGLLGLFGKTLVAEGLKLLRQNGLVLARHNPDYGQVRTLQYQVVGYVAAEGSTRPEALKALAADAERAEEGVENPAPVFEAPESGASSLYKESDTESDTESSPREDAREPDDDCPAVVRAEIEQVREKIGRERVREVLARCEGKARTWGYVLTALRNERDRKRPAPSSAAPPPSGHDYLSGPYASFLENNRGALA